MIHGDGRRIACRERCSLVKPSTQNRREKTFLKIPSSFVRRVFFCLGANDSYRRARISDTRAQRASPHAQSPPVNGQNWRAELTIRFGVILRKV
jgi:hypothetical protein